MRKEIERKFIVNGDAYKAWQKECCIGRVTFSPTRTNRSECVYLMTKAILRLKERQREFEVGIRV